MCAAGTVLIWSILANLQRACPEKVDGAAKFSEEMDAWPVKRIPGRPETQTGELPVVGVALAGESLTYCSSCGETFPSSLEIAEDVCPKCGTEGCLGLRGETEDDANG